MSSALTSSMGREIQRGQAEKKAIN